MYSIMNFHELQLFIEDKFNDPILENQENEWIELNFEYIKYCSDN